MKPTIPLFYSNFYGEAFFRYYIRVPLHKKPIWKQRQVKTSKELYLNVSKSDEFYPSYATVYNYGTDDALKHKNIADLLFDRVYLDFDASNADAKIIQKELEEIQSVGLKHQLNKQRILQSKLRNMVISDRIAEKSINQAKEFALNFQKEFGKPPLLFFSGYKGAHAYLLFNPTKLKVPKESISEFAKDLKEKHDYDTLDLSVTSNAPRANARVPYSKHHATLLTVIPFQIHESYDEIMNNSLNPKNTLKEPLNLEMYHTWFGEYLKEKIDAPIYLNQLLNPTIDKKIPLQSTHSNFFKDSDHRMLIKNILGEPDASNDNYSKYLCPFNDHKDSSPSFTVYENGYYCFGCQKHGNFWQFLKDYYNWNNNQVKKYLKSTQN